MRHVHSIAPTIETERLVLRAFRREDFTHYVAMWGDPAVAQYLGGKPSTAGETWSRILRFVGHWTLLGFGYWAVHERQSGQFAGVAGFGDFKREIDPPFGNAPEIGWAFATAVQGRGYATEAVAAALGWLEGERGRERTVCMIVPENSRSIRIAEKLGYREYARSAYLGHPSILFERI